MVIFLISRLESSRIIDSYLFQRWIMLLFGVVWIVYNWGALDSRILLLRIIITHVVWLELRITRIFWERLLLLLRLRTLIDICASLSRRNYLSPSWVFFWGSGLNSARLGWSNRTSFFIDSSGRRITKISLWLCKLLCKVRIDVSCLINVIKNVRFILIRPLISSWISSHLIWISSHSPIFRLSTIYIICSQIPHRLLNWVVWVAII